MNNIDQYDAATGDYINLGGKLEDPISYNRFRYYYFAYPTWPKLPGDGLYSYDCLGHHSDDLGDYNLSFHYNRMDPMYYTPKRKRQLEKAFEYSQESEKVTLGYLRAPNLFQSQMYREMQCSMSNIQLEINGEIADALFGSTLFQLKRPNTTRYKEQMHDIFNFVVNQQKAVVLEAIMCLKELGIYHMLDCEDLINLYSFSMYHPCATVCHGCRKVNWIYHQADHVESEYMMCMTETCRFAARKRDVPDKAVLALPMHGFNLQHFYDQVLVPEKNNLKTLSM